MALFNMTVQKHSWAYIVAELEIRKYYITNRLQQKDFDCSVNRVTFFFSVINSDHMMRKL